MNASNPNRQRGLLLTSFAYLLSVAFLCLSLQPQAARAEESADELFRSGRYDAALQLAKVEFDRGVWNE